MKTWKKDGGRYAMKKFFPKTRKKGVSKLLYFSKSVVYYRYLQKGDAPKAGRVPRRAQKEEGWTNT